MLSVVCFKWKPKGAYRTAFGPETVNILKQCVKRHYPHSHQFICVTDDSKGLDPDIRVIPLWEDFSELQNPFGATNPSCYRRLKLFSHEAKELIGPRLVCLDLDTVITGDLTHLWNRPEDLVLWGDTNPSTHYNGSMMLMTAGCRPHVWDQFDPVRSPNIAKSNGQFGSDQGWISHILGPKEAKWTIDDGVYSFRIHLRQRSQRELPRSARIVMFHGSIDPWSPQALSLPWVKENWRYSPSIANPIEAINLEKGLVMLDSGKYVKIVQMFDEDGEETDCLDEAVSFIAGAGDHYWSDLFSHFRKIRSN